MSCHKINNYSRLNTHPHKYHKPHQSCGPVIPGSTRRSLKSVVQNLIVPHDTGISAVNYLREGTEGEDVVSANFSPSY